MPIYEYQCNACDHTFEAIQKISEPLLVDCPACGKPDLKKLVSAAAFRLKGGGWYETDFKSGQDKKRNLVGDGAASDTKTESAKSDGAKTESTPAKSEASPASSSAPTSGSSTSGAASS